MSLEKLANYWDSLNQWEQSLTAAVLMLVAFILIRFVLLNKIGRLAEKTNNDLDDRLIHFLKQFLWLIGLFVATAVILKINHIEISPLLAGAGIFGVALGFAAKETIADILSGIFLIADRPIRVGDRVKIENIGRHWGAWGDITNIGLRRTRIRNTDGVIVNYPNSLLSNSVISNFSFEEHPLRVRVRFQVAYHADIDQVRQLVIPCIHAVPGVVADTAEMVTRSLWDDSRGHLLSGILLEARYRIENIRKRTAVRSQVLENIVSQLQQHNIPMAAHPVQISHSTPESTSNSNTLPE
ncbi:MAG: mechanosensitive ion channel family protein [Gammaproteobacteria bacterium]|nr:mechanosensitive ion channel family protein [Gammaproteobacteria bacterium]MDH5801098.1 mechanosensitive ion channel family protein [Gammaproteobacteria bacterium]